MGRGRRIEHFSVAGLSRLPAILFTGLGFFGCFIIWQLTAKDDGSLGTQTSANSVAGGVSSSAAGNLQARGVIPAAAPRPNVKLGALPSREPLWAFLATFVLPHRRRLGRFELLPLGRDLGTEEAEKMRTEFASSVAGQIAATSLGIVKNKIYVGARCQPYDEHYREWTKMPPGSIFAMPLCTAEDYDEVYVLLYTVNCVQASKNDRCKPVHRGLENIDSFKKGIPISCSSLPAPDLDRLGFVQGYMVLEKKPDAEDRKALGDGDILSIALSFLPETTDKVTYHEYHMLYERYLPTFRKSTGNMLEIGLGCNMNYGPGRSAALWRLYFKDIRIEYLENYQPCVLKWKQYLQSKNITAHIGDQRMERINQRLANWISNKGGYNIIIDDGEHSNHAIRTSFRILWPAVTPGGFYVMEDMGTPGFDGDDCEPLQSIRHKQEHTAVASVAEAIIPLLRGDKQSDIQFAECHYEICLLQKVGAAS